MEVSIEAEHFDDIILGPEFLNQQALQQTERKCFHLASADGLLFFTTEGWFNYRMYIFISCKQW